ALESRSERGASKVLLLSVWRRTSRLHRRRLRVDGRRAAPRFDLETVEVEARRGSARRTSPDDHAPAPLSDSYDPREALRAHQPTRYKCRESSLRCLISSGSRRKSDANAPHDDHGFVARQLS